jgi:hypothetical protein
MTVYLEGQQCNEGEIRFHCHEFEEVESYFEICGSHMCEVELMQEDGGNGNR